MPDFAEYLRNLGNLHDCAVTRMAVDADAMTLSFDIEDIHRNFEGLAEYRGPLPGRIVLAGVDNLRVVLNADDGKIRLFISEFVAAPLTEGFAITVYFQGAGEIAASCARATFPDIPAD